MTDQPLPELLEEYGTDEIYLANLEKVAADTWVGRGLAEASEGDWGNLRVTTDPRIQRKIYLQRAQAAAMNQHFRRLERQRMATTAENFGGAGTRRSRYIRTMQTQPYNIHPMLMAGGYGGGGYGGEMAGPAMVGGMGVPQGYGVYQEALSDPGELVPEGRADEVMADFNADADKAASAFIADDMGRAVARAAFDKVASSSPTKKERIHRAIAALEDAASSGYTGFGESSMALGEGLQEGHQRFVNAISRVGDKSREVMSGDLQPTPNWGTGLTPATDVNQYGQVIY